MKKSKNSNISQSESRSDTDTDEFSLDQSGPSEESNKLTTPADSQLSLPHCSTLMPKKRKKPGIVYLSSIPPSMNVTTLRDYFRNYGKIERAYFQQIKDKSIKKSRGVMGKKLQFSEGWIEFHSKKKAIFVTELLNNEPVGGKKSNLDRDVLWNIKYLPRFKWAFLRQQLEHEKEIHRQRMNLEISQVRKEAEHYINASEINAKLKKKSKKQSEGPDEQKKQAFTFKQKLTEEEILERKKRRLEKDEKFKNAIRKKKEKKKDLKKKTSVKNDGFLGSIFVGGES